MTKCVVKFSEGIEDSKFLYLSNINHCVRGKHRKNLRTIRSCALMKEVTQDE